MANMKKILRRDKVIMVRVNDKEERKLRQLMLKLDLPDSPKVFRELLKRAVE